MFNKRGTHRKTLQQHKKETFNTQKHRGIWDIKLSSENNIGWQKPGHINRASWNSNIDVIILLDKITKLIREIYDSSEMLEDHFIKPRKKPNVNERQFYEAHA